MYEPPAPAGNSREDPIRLADWIELNLLTEKESLLSVAGVTQTLAGMPPDNSTASEHRQEFTESLDPADGSEAQEGYWEAAEQITELAFAELRDRSRSFSNRYPLLLDDESAEPDGSFDSPKIATFLTLLRSRQLYKHAAGDDGETAGQLFEELVTHALRRYIDTSERCAVRFGVAGGARGNGLPMNAEAALFEMSRRMNEPRGDRTMPDDNNDYKGDAIAWKPIGDSRAGKLIIIGQATITEGEWDKEPSGRWTQRVLVGFLARPLTAVAFIETMSLNESAILRASGQGFTSIPFDRLRLLFVIRDSDIPESLLMRIREWSNGMKARLHQ